MATRSTLTIKFNMWLEAGEYVSFTTGFSPSISNPLRIETWFPTRTQAKQVTEGSDILDTQANYWLAFDTDYNGSDAFIVSKVGNDTIVIESTINGIQFYDLTPSHPSAQMTADNVPIEDNYTLDSVVLSAAASCDKINVTINTSEVTTLCLFNGTTVPSNSASFSYEWNRGEEILIRCSNAAGDKVTTNQLLPEELKVATMSIAVTNTPTGATATISITNNSENTLEYSLDDTIWYSSNLFTGLATNSYTAYVKDQYGCKVQKNFEVTVFGGNVSDLTPEVTVSKSNSFRWKKDEVWDYNSIYKNDDNTLSFEEDYKEAYCGYRQKFQTGDTIRSQFRTNYDTRVVTVIDENDVETTLFAAQKTANLGKQDKRDGTVYAITQFTIGVYFTSGQTYDYATDIADGTYELNGNLPEWAKIGAWVFIETVGWLEVINIIRKADDTAWVLVFNLYNEGPAPETLIISTEYDARNFEVFEFDIDLNPYKDQLIQLKIVATDAVWPTVTYLSEVIWVKDRHEGTVAISYRHEQNTSTMNYSYGIRNLIRVEGQLKGYSPSGEKEISRGDSETYPVSVSLFEDFVLDVHAEPTGMAEKVAIAVSHNDLLLNGIAFTNIETPETEQIGPQSNLYSIITKVTKVGGAFSEDYTPNASESELIGLLEDNGDYFKIN